MAVWASRGWEVDAECDRGKVGKVGPHDTYSVVLLSFKLEAPPDTEGFTLWSTHPLSSSCPQLFQHPPSNLPSIFW